MILLLLFAFLAGIVTILSPCILPVLPIVLSASLGSGKQRPFGVLTGFVLSFTFFTLLLTAIVKATGVSPDLLRTVAIAVIALFGLALFVPQFQTALETLTSRFSSLLPHSNNQNGFLGGLAVGLSLGLIWTPCVGPILAAVITLAITQTVTLQTFMITFAYALGSSLPMFGIIYGGQKLLKNIRSLVKYSSQIQKAFGVIMLCTAVGLYFNVDRAFQTKILQIFPDYGTGLTALESNSLVKNQLDQLRLASGENRSQNSAADARAVQSNDLLDRPTEKAADFTGGGNWINSQPLSLAKELKGKVVLVDFWTYSCINCIRTLPYLKSWYQKYHEKGFEIVGVHSPEFEFEKNTANVTKAAKDFGLTYPIVQDNDFSIWNAYSNQAWPAHYLIDKQGFIRQTHFGEGKYGETENAIRVLLDEAPIVVSEARPSGRRQTAETYLGYDRFGLFGNGSYSANNKILKDQVQDYVAPSSLDDDQIALDGKWVVGQHAITPQADDASLSINFIGQQVYLVFANPSQVTTPVELLLDGQPLPSKYYTADVEKGKGKIVISEPRKYDLVDLKGEYGRHLLQIFIPKGIEAYAFTFGS